MNYKTIVHELIQANPELHEQLRLTRQLLPTMEAYAIELRTRHRYWTDQLCGDTPLIYPHSVTDNAMELAVAELQNRLSLEDSQADSDSLNLDDAISAIRNPTSPA
jgi:hypothetical protein